MFFVFPTQTTETQKKKTFMFGFESVSACVYYIRQPHTNWIWMLAKILVAKIQYYTRLKNNQSGTKSEILKKIYIFLLTFAPTTHPSIHSSNGGGHIKESVMRTMYSGVCVCGLFVRASCSNPRSRADLCSCCCPAICTYMWVGRYNDNDWSVCVFVIPAVRWFAFDVHFFIRTLFYRFVYRRKCSNPKMVRCVGAHWASFITFKHAQAPENMRPWYRYIYSLHPFSQIYRKSLFSDEIVILLTNKINKN